jgi:hypothetical protein
MVSSVEVELPRYQSHKKVWADKVVKVKDNSGENCEAAMANDSFIIWYLDSGGYVHVSKDLKLRGGENPVGGYYVQYDDGFQSWSPAKAFEEGYTRI